jgi:hypothetical protein
MISPGKHLMRASEARDLVAVSDSAIEAILIKVNSLIKEAATKGERSVTLSSLNGEFSYTVSQTKYEPAPKTPIADRVIKLLKDCGYQAGFYSGHPHSAGFGGGDDDDLYVTSCLEARW